MGRAVVAGVDQDSHLRICVRLGVDDLGAGGGGVMYAPRAAPVGEQRGPCSSLIAVALIVFWGTLPDTNARLSALPVRDRRTRISVASRRDGTPLRGGGVGGHVRARSAP